MTTDERPSPENDPPSNALRAAYEAVSYPTCAVHQTHPDHLATIAILFGMNPAPAVHCRVLEIGCGDGTNLLSMAATLPGSEFVGIDLAAAPIARGQAAIDELKLSNLRLAAADLMEVSPDWGSFDYIIAHGVYSWVPDPVRERLLAICGQNLTPQGVAFVSYNANPGFYLRAMAREMMLYHVNEITDPGERVAQARAFLQFVVNTIPERELFRGVLQSQLQDMQEREDSVVYHDDLAEVNCGVSVAGFVARARAHGLEFLGDAEFASMQGMQFPLQVREQLALVAERDYVRKEQLLDYLKCRSFRRTLLCRQDVHLRRNIGPSDLRHFHLAMNVRSTETEPELAARGVQRFAGPKGLSLATDHPIAQAALARLGENWPGAMTLAELRQQVSGSWASVPEAERVLGRLFWEAYCGGMLELYVSPPRFATTAGERPVASALARWQARHGSVVTNLCHKSIEIKGALERHLLQLLDGTRTQAEIATQLAADIESGLIRLGEQFQAENGEEIRSRVAAELPTSLAALAKLALLELR